MAQRLQGVLRKSFAGIDSFEKSKNGFEVKFYFEMKQARGRVQTLSNDRAEGTAAGQGSQRLHGSSVHASHCLSHERKQADLRRNEVNVKGILLLQTLYADHGPRHIQPCQKGVILD
jgi:hypothetical protein